MSKQPMFNRRHYQAIAKAIKQTSQYGYVRPDYFIELFESDNPLFDEDKFRKDCDE